MPPSRNIAVICCGQGFFRPLLFSFRSRSGIPSLTFSIVAGFLYWLEEQFSAEIGTHQYRGRLLEVRLFQRSL